MRFIPALYLLTLVAFFSCSSEKKTKPVQKITISDGWEFRQANSNDWFPASIPGCIHTDLFQNNLIPDPYFGANEDSLQWIDKKNWEYRTTFQVNEELYRYNKLELHFNGLDTYAEIYLNDSLIQVCNNMYRAWPIDCKHILQPGPNDLRILFKSPIEMARPFWNKYKGAFPAVNEKTDTTFSVYTRKAPYHYGWDWGPRFVTMGIWKPVQLIGWNEAKIEDTYLRTLEVSTKKATYSNHIEINSSYTKKAKLTVEVSTPHNIEGQEHSNQVLLTEENEIEISPGHNFYKIDFTIDKPKLWWPNGHGEQPLYDVISTLTIEDEVIQTTSEKLGVRKLELVQQEDTASGTSFYFKINDQPIFIKGANYIPQEVFTTRVTQDRYSSLIKNVVASNMNMLRVWGGAIYESDEFYDLCDKNGILVWQDFMFACAFYPADDTLAYTIKKEAVDNVKRLRDHPCLALWCGNNEIRNGWESWGWSKKYAKDSALLWSSYHRIFNHILPDVVSSYDPEHAYISTSPLNNDETNFDSTSGDHHEWKIWFGHLPFESYNKRIGRFMSEYGFQSYPELSMCKSMTGEDTVLLNSPLMRFHQKCHMDWHKPNFTGNELIEKYMGMYYKIPQSATSQITLSQFLQADALKIAIEAHRRNQQKCMGTMYWQLNDCWPTISWSTIDYDGNWKYAHYKVKNSYKKVIIDCVDENDSIRVYAISDRVDTLEAQLDFKLQLFNGEKFIDTSIYVSIPPSASTSVYSVSKKDYVKSYNSKYIVASAHLSLYRDYLDDDILYFEPTKNLILHEPKISSKIREIQGGFIIELNSDTLVRGVHIDAGIIGRNNFSDNYIDLVPGVKKIIQYKQNPLTTKSSDFKIRQLLDLY